MDDVGILNHQHIGADYVRAMGLAEPVAVLVEQHVNAKRYLVSTNPEYERKLSAASRKSLAIQGGPMTDQEAAAFSQHPMFRDILKLRAFDEAAKRTGLVLPAPESFSAMIRRNRTNVLTRAQLLHWQRQGYLLLNDWFSPDEVASLVSAVTDLGNWPDTPGKWMKYYEAGSAGRQLCRIENFAPYHGPMAGLLTGTSTMALLEKLLGSPPLLFKEKINFKLPGGNGFDAHQDAPAFTTFNQHFHVTMMVSFDETTVANGCLEVVPGGHRMGMLPLDPDLTIARDFRDSLTFEPVATKPGDILLFDSYLPHRSGANQTDLPRRALYATYNRLADGDVREAYFREKRVAFPPDVEREKGRHYDGGVFNVGNPVLKD